MRALATRSLATLFLATRSLATLFLATLFLATLFLAIGFLTTVAVFATATGLGLDARATAQDSAQYSGGPPREVARRVHREGGYDDQLPVFRRRSVEGGGGDNNSNTGSEDPGRSGDEEDEEDEEDDVVYHGQGGDDGSAEGTADRRARRAGRTSSRGGGASPADGDGTRTRRPGGRPFQLPASLGTVGYVFLIIGIIVLLVLFGFILYSVRGKGGSSLEKREPRVLETLDAKGPIAIRMVEGDPDELAAAGRYEEAIAALLMHALLHVGWRPIGMQRSRTAREILSSVGETDRQHGALSNIVGLQERVAFAGDDATQSRFETARTYYETLTDIPDISGEAT